MAATDLSHRILQQKVLAYLQAEDDGHEREARRTELLKLCSSKPAEPLYYIWDSRKPVGDCGLFWGHNSRGYTLNLNEAGLYPEGTRRDSDIAIPRNVIEQHAVVHVAVDVLRRFANERYECTQRERNGGKTCKMSLKGQSLKWCQGCCERSASRGAGR